MCRGATTECMFDARPDIVVGNVGLPTGDGDYWKPSESQVQNFEVELANALRQAAYDYTFDPPGPLFHYGIQYIGWTRGGERLIYANGFCGRREREAAEQWVHVFDGGTCYFGASFNPETGKLYGPGFNGFA